MAVDHGRRQLMPGMPGFAARAIRRLIGSRTNEVEWFDATDIEHLRSTFYGSGSGQGVAWAPYRNAHMVLPPWFRRDLDPWTDEYRDQQLQLWRLITGVDRPYDPEIDELEADWGQTDAVRLPGYYVRRDPSAIAAASDHVLATGMLLKHSGLVAGDHALEYGAGFAQTALALARLGVNVDTVDISRNFCLWVRQQADFFGVPLRPHQGRFGFNPRPGQRYKLIWFYESFHHCWDFLEVVPRLAAMLADGGRVILSGEPVFRRQYAAVPYPWGVRLHSEVAAVMRQTRWMELGFTEPFLFELFRRSGFSGRRIECEPSIFGRLYVFERRPRVPPTSSAMRWAAGDDRLRNEVGVCDAGSLRSDGRAGHLVFGPFVPMPAGEAWAEVRIDQRPAAGGRVWIDVVSDGGTRLHAGEWFDLERTSGALWLSFNLPEPVTDLEVRARCEPSTVLVVRSVGLSSAD